MLTVITGPVRAGKSRFALDLAGASGAAATYVATAVVDPADPEMVDRVARHRAERGPMPTIETDERGGPRLADVLLAAAASDILIVDSLGTWLGLQVVQGEALRMRDHRAADARLDAAATELRSAFACMKASAVVVAEEVGWSVVPPSAQGRAFRDHLGRLTADLAGRADRAYLVVAGFAVDLRAVGRRVTAS